MNAAVPRKHHWVPQGYLRGFARVRRGKHQLHVVDMRRRRVFVSEPDGIAAERDFNRVDGPEPDAQEKVYSRFETEAAPALRAAAAACRFENDDQRDTILNLAALLAIRHPLMREQMRQFSEQVMQRVLDVTFGSEESYAAALARAEADGAPPRAPVSLEDMQAFIEPGNWHLGMAREAFIADEMRVFDDVLQTMGQRQWSFLHTSDACPFITSDHPVVLTDPIANEVRWGGFGRARTEVVFPLTKRTLIVGKFDDALPSMSVPAATVAGYNTIIIRGAGAQVYASTPDFPYAGLRSGEMRTGMSLLNERPVAAATAIKEGLYDE